jgi:hypothetical protein
LLGGDAAPAQSARRASADRERRRVPSRSHHRVEPGVPGTNAQREDAFGFIRFRQRSDGTIAKNSCGMTMKAVSSLLGG